MFIHDLIFSLSIKRLNMKTTLLFLCLIILNANCLNAQDVKIGKQVWMSKNLDVSTFRNGEVINQVKNTKSWVNAIKNMEPAWCYYNFDSSNGRKYGKLYNWFAIIDTRGLAPTGYHIPTINEWETLVSFLGGENSAFKKLKSASGWINRGNGTNESGFNAQPGGVCNYDCNFWRVTERGFWWSTTLSQNNRNQSYILQLDEDDDTMWQIGYHDYGYSVRCLKD
jgi:uncharacterized protein (TIGR02145 family)